MRALTISIIFAMLFIALVLTRGDAQIVRGSRAGSAEAADRLQAYQDAIKLKKVEQKAPAPVLPVRAQISIFDQINLLKREVAELRREVMDLRARIKK